MGEELSFWDILFLKDEIDLDTYILITWVIPVILTAIVILAVAIHEYWWEIKRFFRKLFRWKV